MINNFFLVDEEKIYSDEVSIQRLLIAKNLYKSLSLHSAWHMGINIPETAVFLNRNSNFINQLINKWNLPLMIRMDYRSLSQGKTLGGIPLHSIKSINSISSFLFERNFCPLFHPYINRFEDVYSAGILVNRDDFIAQFEFVGKGFDASDLRLGSSNSHETISYNLKEDIVISHIIISDNEYTTERNRRAQKVQKLKTYIEYANQKGILLPNLDNLIEKSNYEENIDNIIPEHYLPISKEIFEKLCISALLMKVKLLIQLPYSKYYSISLSYVPKYGWLLWDVYGEWYNR